MRVSILFLMALSSFSGIAAERAAPKSVDGGFWSGKVSGTEMKINVAKSGVFVSVFDDKKGGPHSIEVTFMDLAGNRVPFVLKSVEAAALPGFSSPNSSVFFRGEPLPNASSYVGFEIQFPLGVSRKQVVRSEDLKRTN